MDIIFGPVPSRRLGRSIGINNIPPKHCTYACIYCQLGRAVSMQVDRFSWHAPEEILGAVRTRIDLVQASGEVIDYLTIVPDGEPTLDSELGKLIAGLQETGLPAAVITNGSLLHDAEVRRELAAADWVSVKVDAVSDPIWRRIDRPHRLINHPEMLDGIRRFAEEYGRKAAHRLVTETMLIEGVNTRDDELELIADFVKELHPDIAYLSIPTRPPAEAWALPASEESLARAFGLFSARGIRVEHLTGYEGSEFSATGDSRADLLSITAVHPMREEAVLSLLQHNGTPWEVMEELLAEGLIIRTEFDGHRFFVRRFSRREQLKSS